MWRATLTTPPHSVSVDPMTFNKSDRTAYICNDVRPSLEDVQNSVVDWLAPMWPGPDADRLQAALSDALQALANLEAGAVAERIDTVTAT